jgi:adenine-specific DNA glycosylase
MLSWHGLGYGSRVRLLHLVGWVTEHVRAHAVPVSVTFLPKLWHRSI